MGLAIVVDIKNDLAGDEEGWSSFSKYFDEMNAVLEENGLPPHIEPADLPELRSPLSLQWIPVLLHTLSTAGLCVLPSHTRMGRGAVA